MSDITPGVTNNVPIGTDVFGDTLNPTTIVNYVLLVRTSVPAVIGINASGGPGVNGQPPGPGVIGQAGAGGDADGVRGNASGSFSGVAGFADSGATANSGIGVFGKGGGPQKPLPGQPPQAGGPGVRGFGGSNEFGNDANGVEGFASGSFSGVAGFGDKAGGGTGVYGQGTGPSSQGVRGIGGMGNDTRPADSCGVYGQGGLGSAYGVEGRGSGSLAGVGGFGAGGPLDPGPVSPAGVFGQGGDGNAHGVEGRASGRFAGVAGFGEAAPSTPPVSAVGVYGQAGLGNNNGVEGRGSGNFAGVAGFGDVSPSATGGIGVFAVGGAPAPASGQPGGPGVYAVGFGGPGYTPLNKTAGVYGIGGASNGPGVLGQGGSVAADGVQGSSGSGNGVSGQSGTGVGVRASSGTATGLVAEGATGLIAGTLLPNGTAGQFDGNVVVSGHLTVGGAKSVAVPFPDGSHRRLYCVESPENWFEDFGFGELSDGQAQVQLEEEFRSVVDSNAYHVFITEYGDNNALYVAERTGTSFLVRAKAANADGTFSYRVVAKRRDIAAPRFDKVDVRSAQQGADRSPRQPESVVPVAA